MKRDYWTWHRLKNNIDHNIKAINFRELEVWWCSLGANVGDEQDGKNELFERPVLVFRKFNQKVFWGLPMTSKDRVGFFYFPVVLHNSQSSIILSQLRILSTKRLIRRVGKISSDQFRHLNKTLVTFINETDPFRGPRVPSGNLYTDNNKS